MRKANREVKDIEKIVEVMKKCEVCRIALNVDIDSLRLYLLQPSLHLVLSIVELIAGQTLALAKHNSSSLSSAAVMNDFIKDQCPFLTRSRGQTAKISAVTGMVNARTGAASAGTAPPSCQPFCVTRRSRPPNRCLSLFLMRLKLSGWSPPALRSPRAPHD